MSQPPVRPIFLERQSYRQRRLIDAARLLPILGVILLAVPLLWPAGDAAGLGEGSAGQGLPVSRAMIYIFAVWAGLALASGLLVWRLSVEEVERMDGGTPGAPRERAGPGRLPLEEGAGVGNGGDVSRNRGGPDPDTRAASDTTTEPNDDAGRG